MDASGRGAESGVDEAADDDEAVRVALRIRPLIPKERIDQCRHCMHAFPEDRQVVLLGGKERRFAFDFVFAEDSAQPQIYQEACAPLVQRCFQGYNATVFAYGQVRLCQLIGVRLVCSPSALRCADGQREDVHHGQRQRVWSRRTPTWDHPPRRLPHL